MKKLLFVFAGLAFALTAAAQEFRITHGPYLCDMSQDGVTVVWTTNRPALSWVEASPADSLAPAPPPRHKRRRQRPPDLGKTRPSAATIFAWRRR